MLHLDLKLVDYVDQALHAAHLHHGGTRDGLGWPRGPQGALVHTRVTDGK